MNTKTQLIKQLENSRDTYISGATLAKELSISRNAVWKTVENLREEGYDISAITNKGYRLINSGSTLSESGVKAHLKNENVFQIDVRKSLTSTNTTLRELAANGAPEGYVLVAEEQTSGKGRMGRTFHSPAGHGVYFSLLLRPGASTADATLITTAAAVATARAIEKTVGIHVGIKWVNDLFVNGKKVCGILTEATYGIESGQIESAVLGIGVNITEPEQGYPEDVREIAAAVLKSSSSINGERCRLIAAALDYFWEYYQNLSARKFLDEYKSRSILLDQDIYVLSNDTKIPARVLGIDDDCRLVVRYENGQIDALNSGEVSTKRVRSEE